MICPKESPGSAHNEIEGPLVEIGSRSDFGNSAVGVRQQPAGRSVSGSSQRGMVLGGSGEWRESSGQWLENSGQ